jgi:LuxR family maltose regulon positive regulatory protein
MAREKTVYISDRLKDKMDECFSAGLSVVRAPAGFGKSACTEEYFRRCASAVSKVFWLTCDGMSEQMYCDKFCDCIAEIDQRSAESLRAFGTLNQLNSRHVSGVLSTVTSELPVWFVMDRAECLPESFRVCATDLVKPVDENVHFVIITKEKPALDVPEVTTSDLLLNKSEIIEAFGQAGITLRDKEAAEILRATSGWLTAVSLLWECMLVTGSRPDTADVSTILGAIYDALPGEQRMALRRLCNFSRLTPAKVMFLMELRELPDELRRFLNSFPLIRYSAWEDCWYVHELLSQFIISNSSDIVALARSAAWYSQTGEPGKAVGSYYSRFDYEGVLSIDLSHLDPCEKICGKPFLQIARELARCPAELKLKYPLNMLRVAHILIGEGDYSAYDSLMKEMEAIIRETGDSRNYGEWILESAWQAYPDLEAMCQRVEMAASRIGERSRMVDPYAPFAFNSPSMWYCFHSAAGKADEEAALLERFIGAYSSLTGGHGLGADRLFKGELAGVRGDLDQAEMLAGEAESVARTNGQFSVAVGAILLYGRTAVDRMDSDAALNAIKRLETLLRSFPYAEGAGARRLVNTAIDLLSALIKRPQAETVSDIGAGPVAMIERLAEASRLVVANKLRETTGMLEAMLSMDDRACTLSYRQYIYVGLSICYMRTGNVQRALNCIQTALDISVPDRSLMLFARSGADLDKILKLAEPAYTDAVAQIAEIRSRYLPDTAEDLKASARQSLEEKFRNLPEPLTDREIEIAELAAQGMRNKEIAALLFLSERTVSNRLYTIFQKLGIDRRTELTDFLK